MRSSAKQAVGLAGETRRESYSGWLGKRQATLSIYGEFPRTSALITESHTATPERLRIPAGYHPLPGHLLEGRAPVLFWNTGSEPLLMVLVADDNKGGTDDAFHPVVFRKRGGAWSRSTSVEELYVPDQGGFYTSGRRLMQWQWWDLAGESTGHYDNHHYRLREYRWSRHRLRLVRTRITRGRYYPWDSHGGFVAGRDPLRELGVRWRFWSP
jgi:hypothetical protein